MNQAIMNIEIRPVLLTEAKALWEVSLSTFIDAFANKNSVENMDLYINSNLSLDVIEAELKSIGSSFYFITIDKRVAGYMKIVIPATHEEIQFKSVELQRIYIHKNFQNQGLGQRLLQKAEAIAINYGSSQLWLGVWEHNQQAISFYERHGYERCSEHVFWLGNDRQIDFLFSKNLITLDGKHTNAASL